MKVTLGMICKNEEAYLSVILPIVRASFDELVVVDAESTDGTVDLLKRHNAKIHVRPWTNDFSAARNEVIKNSTGDWIFMLDCDEAMFPGDIQKVRGVMAKSECIVLPRVEFVGDYEHYDPKVAPDYQCRVFKVGVGYWFRSRVHEMLCRGEEGPVLATGRGLYMKDCPIYHYGQCKPRETVWLRHHNYWLVQHGQPPLKEFPKGMEVQKRVDVEPYRESHPLRNLVR